MAASDQPAVASASSLSISTISPVVAAMPAFAAAQKPFDFGNRITSTPSNSAAVRETIPSFEPSSTTIHCVPAGEYR